MHVAVLIVVVACAAYASSEAPPSPSNSGGVDVVPAALYDSAIAQHPKAVWLVLFSDSRVPLSPSESRALAALADVSRVLNKHICSGMLSIAHVDCAPPAASPSDGASIVGSAAGCDTWQYHHERSSRDPEYEVPPTAEIVVGGMPATLGTSGRARYTRTGDWITLVQAEMAGPGQATAPEQQQGERQPKSEL
ncbi:hypothetical protein Pelo_532 [Pelomyxa schiedti]|nr:hypothetical protein Pelo_532 [Pelomyxa schiedti]